MTSISVSDNINALMSLDKQLIFATAKSLTQVAKAGQSAAVQQIPKELNTSRPWYLPSNKYGVRIKPATKQNLSSEVYSNADWLAALATGQPHVAQGGGQIAVPTDAARPLPIRKGKRPRGSFWKKAFIIKTKSGLELIVKRPDLQTLALKKRGIGLKRVSRSSGYLVVGYVLKRSVRRPKKDPLTHAVARTVEQKFPGIFSANLKDAIATAK
jgi:minor tail protein Z (GPZ)